LQPEKPELVASEGGKKWGQEKTIERFGGKKCRSSGLLIWLTFGSRIALYWARWKTGWLLKS
jgi:hypothetical protein